MNVSEELGQISIWLKKLGDQYGFGYLTFLICEIFRFRFPYQVRWILDPSKYDESADDHFDIIQVKRLLEEVQKNIGRTVHPRCYYCGQMIEDKEVYPGSFLSYFLCDHCTGPSDTLTEEESKLIHDAIQHVREETRLYGQRKEKDL